MKWLNEVSTTKLLLVSGVICMLASIVIGLSHENAAVDSRMVGVVLLICAGVSAIFRDW